MEKLQPLMPEEIEEKLRILPGWTFADNKISKEFKFQDFMESLGFINKLAPFFEKKDHHPDIHIYYNKVLFELQRFDSGGRVTQLDLDVAAEIERRYGGR